MAYIPDMSREDSKRARHRQRQAAYEARQRAGVALGRRPATPDHLGSAARCTPSRRAREMTIFAEQYDFAVTLLLLENRHGYVQLDQEPVEDAYDRFTSQT
jgi:hypothetical protein